jgi:hypothetical protein
MSGVNLALDDAVELTELLQFIDTWLANHHEQLNVSLRHYVGPPQLRHQPAPSHPRPVHLPARRRHRRQSLPTPVRPGQAMGDPNVRRPGKMGIP